MAVSPRRAPRFEFLCDLPTGDTHSAAAHERPHGWRLVAGNNRTIGRARTVSASYADCVASADAVRRDRALLADAVSLRSKSPAWQWELALDGSVVAVCSHPYSRRPECVRAVRHFLDALERADPRAGIVRHFGPRSLTGYEQPTPALTVPQ